VTAERALLKRLGGGCHVPVGARARVENRRLKMIAVVAHPEGNPLYRAEIAGSIDNGAQLGEELAESLLRQGADTILAVR
jgi:hydroxymethylbilane synthase